MTSLRIPAKGVGCEARRDRRVADPTSPGGPGQPRGAGSWSALNMPPGNTPSDEARSARPDYERGSSPGSGSDMDASASLRRVACAPIPTVDGTFELCVYASDLDPESHMSLTLGELGDGRDVLTRVHSECFTGEVLGSLRCDCAEQLSGAMQAIGKAGRGVLVYLRQEGRGIGLADKLRAYKLQDEGYDTVDANLHLGHAADERDYTIAAVILRALGVSSVRLLTNNPDKVSALTAAGIEVRERIPLPATLTAQNERYLKTKADRMRHELGATGKDVAARAQSGANDAIATECDIG